MVKSIATLAVVFLTTFAQAEGVLERRQWPWSNQGASAPNQGWDRAPRQTQQSNPWGRPPPPQEDTWGRPPGEASQLPRESYTPRDSWGRQPTGRDPTPTRGQQPPRTRPTNTLTVTRTRPRGDQTQAPVPTVYEPAPVGSLTQTGTWSQPSSWGPPRNPFGPNTQTGPSTIATHTQDAPRLPVPFLTSCGGLKYLEDDVHNALLMGCLYKNKTQTINDSGYPKPFPNTQRFNFGVIKGPYWEYPLINSAGFIGGDPGPDRIIFNTACFLAGEITQTGAGSRGWAECREEF